MTVTVRPVRTLLLLSRQSVEPCGRVTIQRKIVARSGYSSADRSNTPHSARSRELPVSSKQHRPFVDRVGRVGIVLDTRDVEMIRIRCVRRALAASGRDTRAPAPRCGSTRIRSSAHFRRARRTRSDHRHGALAVQQTIETSEGPLVALGRSALAAEAITTAARGAGKIVYGVEADTAYSGAAAARVKLVAFYDADGSRPRRNGAPHAPRAASALVEAWRWRCAQYTDYGGSWERTESTQ